MKPDMKKIALLISEARKNKNLSLDDIHEQTRIPVHHLVRFEAGEMPDLPETYITAFLKTLFNLLEIEEDLPDLEIDTDDSFELTDDDFYSFKKNTKIGFIKLVPFALLFIIIAVYLLKFQDLFHEPPLPEDHFFSQQTEIFHLYMENGYEYEPDSLIINSIKEMNPKAVLYCFADPDQELSLEMVNIFRIILERIDSPDLILKLESTSGENLSSNAAANKIQILPACLVLYKDLEIGRITGKPSVPVETRLYEILKIIEN